MGGAAEATVARVMRELGAAGLRLTGARRRLLGVFAGLGRWCTPQELHAAAKDQGCSVGLATVYRFLGTLLEHGLCRAFPQPDGSTRYVLCPPGHHHHLICRRCGRVADVADCRVEAPAGDFLVEEHAIDFFGLCPACRGGS
jgi:Fur family ferric uptake transcriptional regulator